MSNDSVLIRVFDKNSGEVVRVKVSSDVPLNGSNSVQAMGLFRLYWGGARENQEKIILTAASLQEVTLPELVRGFWSAVSDPFISAGTLEWRHVWKHIKAERTALLSYEEALAKLADGEVFHLRFEAVNVEGSELPKFRERRSGR